MATRCLSGVGSKNTGWYPWSVSTKLLELLSPIGVAASSPSDANWYRAWSPSSDAANRNPVFNTHMSAHGGTVSKYTSRTFATASPPPTHFPDAFSSVTLYTSPYSLCAKTKKPSRLVLCAALDTMSTPRSPESALRRGITARSSAAGSFSLLYITKFSAHTSTPPGPSVPPGIGMSRFAPLSTGSLERRATWLSPRSSS